MTRTFHFVILFAMVRHALGMSDLPSNEHWCLLY